MSLQEKLDQIRAKSKSRLPDEAKAIMRNATALLVKSGQVDRAMPLGGVAPDFVLQDTEGATWDTRALRSNGSYLLVFIRGHW